MYFSYIKMNLDFFNTSLIHQLFAPLDDLDSHLLHELQETIHSEVIHAVVRSVFNGGMIQLDMIQKGLHSVNNVLKNML